eukprot:c10995_g2_i1 orf=246-1061(+)
MGVSNVLIIVLNVVTAVLSIPLIAAGAWLAKQHSTDCFRFLQGPVIALGVFILLVSIAGCAGASCRNKCLLWIYLVVMFLLIVLLFIFTIFAFVVTNKTAGNIVGNKGYKEYRLGDYSTWLQRQVNKASNWDKIESCISEANFCSDLAKEYPEADYSTAASFSQAELSPIQSGCCIPPSVCGCTFKNATFWSPCSNTTASTDCTTYKTDSTTYCYNCNSCKAGVLQNITKDWRKVAVVNIVMLVFLIIVYSVGCCAFRNVKNSGYGKGGYP